MGRNSTYWSLCLMSAIYMVGELGHFLIGPVSRSMAQEMKYGDKGCLPKSSLDDSTTTTCKDDFNETECLSVELNLGNGTAILGCDWDYNGLGLEYQILAGPSFIFVFAVAGLGWGYLADKYNRVKFLSLSTLMFSVSIAATAFATKYWHVVLFRMALAAGEAGCSPLASGIIADTFPASQRGLAMSIFNWGIYIGYGFSYAVGNYVTSADILGQGWRASYVLSGLPGIIVAILFFVTVKEPSRTSDEGERSDLTEEMNGESRKKTSNGETDVLEKHLEMNEACNKSVSTESCGSVDEEETSKDKIEDTSNVSCMQIGWEIIKRPAMIILTVGACIRHFAGYTWGYNSALYFQTYYPDSDVSWWLTGISIGGGAVGVAMGGYLSDRLVNKLGISARALVLATSQLIAAPFAFAVFFLDPPYAMYCLLAAYVAAEMWFGVMFAVMVELVPADVRSTAIGILLFIINNFGGNLPVIVDPLKNKYDYRTAILALYPGALITSSLLFFLCWIILTTQQRRRKAT